MSPNVKRAIPRASEPLSSRGIGNSRTGSGVVENAYPLPRRERPGFSRINEPRANYPPACKLSWKYWKVGGVEWLLPVSATTIPFCVEAGEEKRSNGNLRTRGGRKIEKPWNGYTRDRGRGRMKIGSVRMEQTNEYRR